MARRNRRQLLARIESLITALPERCRAVVVTHDIEGYTHAAPPAYLESRIATAVSRRRPHRLLYAAAAILLFCAGFAFRAWRTRTPEFTHVLFLSNGPTYQPASNPMDRVNEYRAW